MSEALATLVQQSIEDTAKPSERMWLALESLDWTQNKPWLVARILTESPWNLTPAMALAVTMTAKEEGANPFTNDIYVIDGKIVFSVQFKLKKARQLGMQLGIPQYEFVERDWPVGKQLYNSNSDRKAKLRGFKLDKDRGCKCSLKIGTEVAEQTAWLSSSHRPSQPWNEDPDHMLKVRAIDYVLRFIGVGISEPISQEEDKGEVKQPQGHIEVKSK